MKPPAYRIDATPVAAPAFYAAACDPQRSVVVEACAGAGKTWILVSRILRALLAGVEPQQILAITFTRKAAGEMRARLDEWLLAFSAGHCDDSTRVQALCERGLSAADAAALAPALGALHERLLRGGRGVEVRTFHGWFAQLLAHAPLSLLDALGLPAAYETVEDASGLRPALMRRFHRAVQDDAALHAGYAALVARHRRATFLQWLDAAWRRGGELARADAAGHAADAVPAAAALWPACHGLDDPALLLQLPPLASQIDGLARQLGATGKAKAEAAAQGLRDALEAPAAATAFERAWAALFTLAGEPRKQLGDSPLQQAVVDALRDVRAMRQQQRAHEDHVAMLRLARVLLVEYAQLKRDRGLVDMVDLEHAAEGMLGDREIAGWVQERLDQRLRQVLIDEFQDTSPLQWQALHGWLQSYAGAGGGASGQRPPAVFIVGDPKQSIYRFRGAEPRVFEAARDFVVEGLAGKVLQCDHTRRNAPAVIDAINAVFDDAAQRDGWGPFRPHSTGSQAAGAVRRLPGVPRAPRETGGGLATDVWRDSLTQPRIEAEVRRRAEEAAQVAAAVADLIVTQGLAPGEVMVLARKRVVLAAVAEALAHAGVPHVVAEPLALHQSPEVLDLIAVLDVLASPGHDLSLARALKSPLFGAGDDDLLWLSQAVREPADVGFGWLHPLLGASGLPSAALARAQGLLGAWAAAAPSLPPHDLLDRIVHEGELLQRLAAAVPPSRRAGALHAVNAVLAASLAHQGARVPSLYRFVRELRAGRVEASGLAPAAAVQLLTVHGAKGLEARAVIVVDADPEPRQAERATLLVDWPVEQAAPRRVAFVRSESALPPSLAGPWAAEVAAREREELNGLYVAMTRAREWLVFSRTEPSRRAPGQPWWDRVQAQAQVWAPPARAALAGQADARVPTLPALHWQASPATGEPAAEDPAAARLGQAVHRMLEWAGQPGAALPREHRPAASAAAAAAFGLPTTAAARVLTLAGQVLDSGECARFFAGPALDWAGNEVPVVADGELLRIDRLVALRDSAGGRTWWVLDYKLQSTPQAVPAYREQLQRYVAAVQSLQPGDPVRGAFITGGGALVSL